MSKELEEALKNIKIRCHSKCMKYDPIDFDLEIIEQALQRLAAIDNTKPSEALECLEEEIKNLEIKLKKNIKLRDKLTIYQHRDLENCFSRISKYENKLKQLNTIKQALIKAEEQEKVLEIIKNKQVDVNLFITLIPFNKSVEELTRAYNQCFIERCRLTIEETTLLKKWLEK